jgi:hypothetical protein
MKPGCKRPLLACRQNSTVAYSSGILSTGRMAANAMWIPNKKRRGTCSLPELPTHLIAEHIFSYLGFWDYVSLAAGCKSLAHTAIEEAAYAGLHPVEVPRHATIEQLNAFCNKVWYPFIRVLDLHLCRRIRRAPLGCLERLCSLTEVTLPYGYKGDIRLHKLKTLRQLTWNDAQLELELAHMYSMPGRSLQGGITALDLSVSSSFDDNSLSSIRDMPLRELKLDWCPAITGRFFAWLPITLTSLSLRSCKSIDGKKIAVLSRTGSQITALDLSYCSGITDAALEYLRRLPLRDLNLGHSGVFGVGLWHLRDALLNVLDLTWLPIVDDNLEFLRQMPLTSLTLKYCRRITHAGLRLLPRKKLTLLDLTGCSISEDMSQELKSWALPQLHLDKRMAAAC